MSDKRNQLAQNKLLNFPGNMNRKYKRKWVNLTETYFRIHSYVDNEEYFIRNDFFEEFALDLDQILEKWQDRSFAKDFKEKFRYKANDPSEEWNGKEIL